jgi:hypothetical protein
MGFKGWWEMRNISDSGNWEGISVLLVSGQRPTVRASWSDRFSAKLSITNYKGIIII